MLDKGGQPRRWQLQELRKASFGHVEAESHGLKGLGQRRDEVSNIVVHIDLSGLFVQSVLRYTAFLEP